MVELGNDPGVVDTPRIGRASNSNRLREIDDFLAVLLQRPLSLARSNEIEPTRPAETKLRSIRFFEMWQDVLHRELLDRLGFIEKADHLKLLELRIDPLDGDDRLGKTLPKIYDRMHQFDAPQEKRLAEDVLS